MIITISPSSIETLQSCPQAYKYSSIDRLRPIEEDTSKMDRGTLFHKLLAMHYRMQMNQDPATKLTMNQISLAIIASAREMTRNDEFPHEMVEECIENYGLYTNFYQSDNWNPIAVEAPFSVKLYSEENLKIILEGIMDLIVEIPGMKFPVDHKTTERAEYRPTILNNQFMAYCYATGSKNFVKNEVGFQKSYGADKRFHRHMMSYTEDILEEWKNQVVFDIMKTIGYKDNDFWPQNYSNCKYCRYKPICETDPASREYKIETLYKKGTAYDIYTARL